MPDQPDQTRQSLRSGPGRVLVAVYAVFAISATARAAVQLLTKFQEAPVAYLLSGFAAVVYIVATVALIRGGRTGHRVASIAVLTELIGVVGVGLITLIDTADFPKATVWSDFGQGYGYVPLVLPILGLWWLWHTRPTAAAP